MEVAMKLLLAVREMREEGGRDVPRTTKRLLVKEVDWPVFPGHQEPCVLGRDEASGRNIVSRRWIGVGSIVHNFVGEVIEVTLEPLMTENFDALREGDNGWHLQGGRSEV